MINGNLTLDDARYNTNAPFTYESSVEINGTALPVDWFRSIRVYCSEGCDVPIRIGSMSSSTKARDTVDIDFVDASGTLFGTASIFLPGDADTLYKGVFIINPNDVIVGHVVYARELAGMLISVLSRAQGNSLAFGRKSFVLLPQCHVAYAEGHGRVIEVNGKRYTRDITIVPGALTHTDVAQGDNAYQWRLSVVGVYNASLSVNGLCRLKFDKTVKINNVDTTVEQQTADSIWIGGEHLLIRHSITSNLRVVPLDNGIEFRSVKDG